MSRPLAPLLVGIALAGACTSRARGPHDVAPSGSPVAENARCASCHAAQARSHQASKHAQAFVDPAFRAAFAVEPEPFCLDCHAPEQRRAGPAAPNGSADAELGIACTTCHPGGARTAPKGSPDAACVRCHEFAFPGETRLLQSTATERGRGRFRDVACITCHARTSGDGARDHGFAATLDPSFLRGAAHISARREGDALVVRFVRAAVGHAFPTGDVFRRIRVRLVGLRGGAPATLERGLSRKAKLGPAADDRPFADGTDVAEVRVPLDGLADVAWDVRYERVSHPLDREERAVRVIDAVELAHGRVD